MDQIERYRQKMNEIKTGFDKCPRWKPKEGQNVLRILPKPAGKLDWFVEFQCAFIKHNNKNYCLVPNPNDSNDPHARHVKELLQRGDEASRKEANEVRLQQQVGMFVIDRADESKGPQLWTTTPKNLRAILVYCVDPKYGDITLPEPDVDGKGAIDVIIDFVPKEKSPTKFAQYTIRCDRFASSLSKDPNLVKLWTAEDLFEKYDVGKPSEPDYAKALLDGTIEEFIASRQGPKDGAPAAPPPPAPLPPGAQLPDGMAAGSQVWLLVDGQTKDSTASQVASLVAAGNDPTVYVNGWKKASEAGFRVVVVAPPTPPTAPPPPAPPAPPSPPVPSSIAEDLQKQIEELKAKAAGGLSPAEEIRRSLMS